MGKVVITGASGWLGRACIERLINHFGYSKDSIFAFGNKKRRIYIDEYNQYIEVNSFDVFTQLKGEEFELFIPLAFITKDKLTQVDAKSYYSLNNQIINAHLKFTKHNRVKHIFYISSGAVYKNVNLGELVNTIEEEPYGFLKLTEERTLQEYAYNKDTNLSIIRLWNCSGYGLQKIDTFALSNIVNQARLHGKIEIKSDRPLWRRFADSQELVTLGIKCCLEEAYNLFNSGGPKIEIGDLASQVVAFFGGNIEISRPNHWLEQDPEYYLSNDLAYEYQMRKIAEGVVPMGITQQIANTVKAIEVLEKELEK